MCPEHVDAPRHCPIGVTRRTTGGSVPFIALLDLTASCTTLLLVGSGLFDTSILARLGATSAVGSAGN